MTKQQLQAIEELLMVACRAADKLNTMFIRGECEKRSEVEHLVDERETFRMARRELSDYLWSQRSADEPPCEPTPESTSRP